MRTVQIVPSLLLLLLMAVLPARADEESDALRALEHGIELFNRGELPAAREAFEKARRLAPAKANPYRWLGMTDARLDRCKEAIEDFTEFMKRVPADDPRTAEAVTVRDHCIEVLAPKVGTLEVDSTPPGANVRIDDENGPVAGTTPYRFDAVHEGAHVVFVDKPGFARSSHAVTVRRGETATVSVPLSEAAAVAGGAGAPVEEKAPQGSKALFGAALGVGVLAVASVVVGGVLLGLYGSDFHAQEAACGDLSGHVANCPTSVTDPLKNDARPPAGYALLGIGGAAAVADIALWAVVAKRRSTERARTSFRVVPTGLGLAAVGTF
jgi:hypothetical protein